MLSIAGNILPIFFLILIGFLFKQSGFPGNRIWAPAERLAYYARHMGENTFYGVKITQELLKITRSRYLTLLMGKHNVTNGQLPTINR